MIADKAQPLQCAPRPGRQASGGQPGPTAAKIP